MEILLNPVTQIEFYFFGRICEEMQIMISKVYICRADVQVASLYEENLSRKRRERVQFFSGSLEKFQRTDDLL